MQGQITNKKKDGPNDEKKSTTVSHSSNYINNSSTSEMELQSEIDMLGNLDIDEFDNILNIADNMAVKLASLTTQKIKQLAPGKMIS